MKNNVSQGAMIGVIAAVVVVLAVVGFKMFGPEGTPTLHTAPIKMAITPPAGGHSEPAAPLQVNVHP